MNRPPNPTVFHYYARYLAHPSGVTDSINNWVLALSSKGGSTRIVGARVGSAPNNEFADADRTLTVPHIGWNRATWLPLGLMRLLRRGDLLVLHEGWVLSNLGAAIIARIRRVPYIVVPHGVYERGIIESTRDFAGARVSAEKWLLRNSAAVHVFYRGETEVVRDLEPKTGSYIVHPNGAPTSSDEWTGSGDYFLWIGRFDPHHKGLDNLVRSWARLPEPRPRLILAGPDFRGGRAQIKSLVDEHGLSDTITIRGRVSGDEKTELMREARAYVHPSRWESCSIMLLEMLGLGVPAVISETIHAAGELEPVGAVMVASFEADPNRLAATIDAVDRNVALGHRAREWVEEDGSWEAVTPAYVQDIEIIQRSYA